jgi:glycosidase
MPWDRSGPGGGFTTGTPWEPLEDGWETRNVAAALADDDSLLAHYKSLVAVRAAHPALATGTFTPVETGSPTAYGFLAEGPGEAVIVLINLGADPVDELAITLPAPLACGVTGADLVYADPATEGTPSVTAPRVATDGSIASWQPVPVVGPRGTIILALER